MSVDAEPSSPVVFPFIVGCARSGTTLLRAMLDSHSELAVPPESYFVATLAHWGDVFETQRGFDRQAFLDALQSHEWFLRWALDEEDVRRSIHEANVTDLADAVRNVYRLYASSRDKQRYGDKTPEYVCSIKPIARVLPEARFVHLVRDGRDVARSLASPGMAFGVTGIGQALLFWERRVTAGRRQGEKLGPRRYHELRYEELIEDPEDTLHGVCDFLGLEYQPAMLRYYERADEVLRGVPSPEKDHPHLREAPSKVKDWRRDLSPSDIQLADALVGSTLERFGYERTGSSLRHMQARALRLRLDADLHRLGRSAKRRVARARGPSASPFRSNQLPT